MRGRARGSDHSLVLGFYQDKRSVRPVVQALGLQRVRRYAVASVGMDGRFRVERAGVRPWAVLLGAALGAALAWAIGILLQLEPSDAVATAIVAGAAAAGAFLAWLLERLALKEPLRNARTWTLVGESLLLVQVPLDAAALVATVLTEQGLERPPVFVLQPFEEAAATEGVADRLPGQSAGMNAEALALQLETVEKGPPKRPLLPKLGRCEAVLAHCHNRLAGAMQLDQGVALSAEWLLDNAHVINGHIEDFKSHMPSGFYKELPCLVSGEHAGYPRVYAIACELVMGSDARLSRDAIQAFLQVFQSRTILTSAELWALPIMLRLRLIEHVADLGSIVDRRQRESDRVALWANRLLYAARRQPSRVPSLLSSFADAIPQPTPHVVEQLVAHLYDEEAVLIPVRAWLQGKFPAPLADVVRQDERVETAEQVSLANAISTLRLLSQLDWREVFDAVSHLEAVLWGDPAQAYGAMDFGTKDQYRHAVEDLSRKGEITEETIARASVELAREATGAPFDHVGYYLIDDGRLALERRLEVRPRMRQSVRRWAKSHAALIYLGGLALGTAIAVVVPLAAFPPEVDLTVLLALAALLVLPASELAVQFVNFLLTRLLPPHPLPKLSFEEGIPDEFRTLVVVPMMLQTPLAIREEAERLAIRALANPDPNLRFALLADYSDAPSAHMPEDLERLDVAARAIEELNGKIDGEPFLLFYRERRWSDCEQAWIGWERKRGKLEDLNAFLRGDSVAGEKIRHVAGDLDAASSFRFLLTLDSDTQLPRDTAHRLVGTLAHPLNRPRLSPDGRSVQAGYTIIQPRISTSLPSATATLFTRLFTDPTGMDPYTHAVSDVYQDLSGSASYHGKGIYDLASFHDVLNQRFPESHLLSHDLLEGAHVRVGLASDIELLDMFPKDYPRYCARLHRWTRGDWQIADWLLPTVPAASGGRAKNPLPSLERWKILDNLRRSLVPIGVLSLLLVGLSIAPVAPLLALFVGMLLFAPMAFSLLGRLTRRWKIDPAVWREPALDLMRTMLLMAVLPHQAAINAHAILTVAYRRRRRRKLLEWSTAKGESLESENAVSAIFWRMLWVPLFSAAAVGVVLHFHPDAAPLIVPFAALWSFSPVLIYGLDQPIVERPDRELAANDRSLLRQIARQTWRYYDDFVGPDTHDLPPDNYQDAPHAEIAERTSPTNIGLYLLSVVAAHDFGYATPDEALGRLNAALSTVGKMAKHRGHLLNWYDTATLAPLGERYISMVDSTNLMGCLWALRRGCDDLLDQPIVAGRSLEGLADTFGLFRRALGDAMAESRALVLRIHRLLSHAPERLEEIVRLLYELEGRSAELTGMAERAADLSAAAKYWQQEFSREVSAWAGLTRTYLGWVEVLTTPPEGGILGLGPDSHTLRRTALQESPSLRATALGTVPGLTELRALAQSSTSTGVSEELQRWLNLLEERALASQALAQRAVAGAGEVQDAIQTIDDAMETGFLYDKERRLFAVGFNVAEQRLDRSHYDLLASEARLGSFLAIARGEVPTEHWWVLGRPFGLSYLRRVLLSWNGTMFEYLLPLLLTPSYPNSLLDQACRAAVNAHIAFARRRGVPWGISESAFSALDSRHVYQYRAFGVPALALKRSTDVEVVVAPYASALALSVRPKTAVQNLRRLAGLGSPRLRGTFGFYDAIDYSREREPQGQRGIVVQVVMAHHQAMTLLAIDNTLNGQIMQSRFQADMRVQATLPLLYERVPVAPPLVKLYSHEARHTRLTPLVSAPTPGRIETPDTVAPRAHLLSNGQFHVMVTNAGGGSCRWREFDLTRWRPDTTSDDWGTFCYFKDLASGFVWAAPHQPLCIATKPYQAVFTAEKAAFKRRDRGIDTSVEVVVSPEDDVEIRRITLINRTNRTRSIEITSYAELALSDHAADRSHPAFNKLFIETAILRDLDALLAWRRKRSPAEASVWVAQVLASEPGEDVPAQFETDRAAFIGRGRSARNPIGLEGELEGNSGFVLDPIFSLRRSVTLGPRERVQVSLATVAAETREQVVALVAKYGSMEECNRAFQLAWTHAQLELRHLRVKPVEAQLYQELAGSVIYPHSRLRASAERIAGNTLGQSRLWAHGVSGDLPIVVATIGEEQEMQLIEEIVAAHEYWRVRGLRCDLVILNEEDAGYDQPLQDRLVRLVQARTPLAGIDQPAGVFVRRASDLGPEEVTLIHAAARLLFVAARGSLSQQIGSLAQTRLPAAKSRKPTATDEPSPPLPYLELRQFNGTGGFSKDGREYVVYLEEGKTTPRPWSNVIANPDFGTLVTDEGTGFVWSGNSQSNRLTPWCNDPISNAAGDALYLYDPHLDELWTPTALPIREKDAYRARHGQGYTVYEHNSHAIEQEVTVFVPTDASGGAPVRVQLVKLTNRSSRRRTLWVTFFAEWVLGTDRETTQPHVVTSWDLETRSLFARNAFNDEFGNRIAFAACTPSPSSFSGDRAEMLGRNGSWESPAGMRLEALSGKTGAGRDPCAALRVRVEIDPGRTAELQFLLGQASSADAARDWIRRYSDRAEITQALAETKEYWNRILETVQIETPAPEVDLLVNRWLLYQTLSCRLWGRSGFYQSGGAYGFRDQLQDSTALLYSTPAAAREHILRSAARQFEEGDVQHWWHPQSGAGVRTRISDDLLWLVYATAQYVRVTGDAAILQENLPFLAGRPLEPGEHDVFTTPQTGPGSGSLLEHCRRAVMRGVTSGAHGLPLIGGGDWNDGLNLVGVGGKGESVWLGWFAVQAMRDLAELLDHSGESDSAIEYRERATLLSQTIDEQAWDGGWYRRAYFDDGAPLGSKVNDEMKIDSLPQSWAVLCGAETTDHIRLALNALNDRLVRGEEKLVLLFDPPFDQCDREPGYIKGYPPGVRENGGQYTHGSLWAAMAWARIGDGAEAVRLLQMMNPLNHSSSAEESARYQVEPYVVAADVYALPGRVGMGGWTWYSGSSAWMYRAWLEEVLGFKLRGASLTLEPVLPADWKGFNLRFRFGNSLYRFEILNPDGATQGVVKIVLDGEDRPVGPILLLDDGADHNVLVTLGGSGV